MTASFILERAALGDRLRSVRAAVAGEVARRWAAAHPAMWERWDERQRQLTVADVAHHVEFLAAAVEAGGETAFADYVAWTRRVLEARGLAADLLEETLRLLEQALALHLDGPEQAGVASLIAAGRHVCSAPVAPAAPTAPGPHALAREVYVQAILAGSRQAALRSALEALRAGCDLLDVYVEILEGALREVGRRWEANLITVAQEHMATAVTQYVMGQLFAQVAPTAPGRGRAVVTGVEGELHQVGANMVADALEMDGWDVRFLGSNLPHDGILATVRDQHAELVGISATTLLSVPKVRQLVTSLRAEHGPRVKVMLGGGTFRAAPDLWRELGADGCADDLRSARQLAVRLTS